MKSAWNPDMAYAPFNTNGDMLRYTNIALTKDEIITTYIKGQYVSDKEPDITFKPMNNVQMVLELDHFEPKTNTFWWKQVHKDIMFPMFPTEFNDMLKKGINESQIDGVWTITKRGTGFGLKFVE